MSDFSNICRDLINTRDTIKNQLAETLVTELVTDGQITRNECKILLSKVNQPIDQQIDGLIDRVLAVEAKKAATEASIKTK